MEVIYTGLRQTPEMIVNAALQEDVNVIGLSILSGAHNAIIPRVMDLLKQNKMDDVLVVLGGIIPDQDVASMKKAGVAAIFQPGTAMEMLTPRDDSTSPSLSIHPKDPADDQAMRAMAHPIGVKRITAVTFISGKFPDGIPPLEFCDELPDEELCELPLEDPPVAT